MASGIALNQVVDVQWKFGVTAASSDSQAVGSTFFHLNLTVEDSNGIRKPVFVEMTLPQFYSFLHELEKAKSSMDYLG